jgi:hypothetical protein
MNFSIRSSFTGILFAALLVTPFVSAAAQDGVVPLACGDTATSFTQAAGESVVVSCPADCPDGSVWGSDIYTDDSNICTAARHAGVIDESGGVFTLLILDGLDRYKGSEQNGVTTAEWSTPWARSIAFDDAAPEVTASFVVPPLTVPMVVSTADGVFSALAPEGWAIVESELPVIANSETVVEAGAAGMSGEFPPDSFYVQVALPDTLRDAFDGDADVDVVTAIEQLIPLMEREPDTEIGTLDDFALPHAYLFTEPGVFTPEGLNGALLAVDYDGTTLVYVVGFNIDTAVAESILRQIADSAEFTAADVSGGGDLVVDGRLVFEDEADGLVFSADVPEGWVTQLSDDGAPVLASNREVALAILTNPEDGLPDDSIGVLIQMPGLMRDAFGLEPSLRGQALMDALVEPLQPAFSPPQKLAALDAPAVLMQLADDGDLPEGLQGAVLLALSDGELVTYVVLYNAPQAAMEAALTDLIATVQVSALE